VGGRKVEGRQTAGCEQADELGDVAERVLRRDVLEGDRRVDEVEGAVVEDPEVVGEVDDELAAVAEPVELACLADHRGGDVDADAPLEGQVEQFHAVRTSTASGVP
jgi:hypothetical protein